MSGNHVLKAWKTSFLCTTFISALFYCYLMLIWSFEAQTFQKQHYSKKCVGGAVKSSGPKPGHFQENLEISVFFNPPADRREIVSGTTSCIVCDRPAEGHNSLENILFPRKAVGRPQNIFGRAKLAYASAVKNMKWSQEFPRNISKGIDSLEELLGSRTLYPFIKILENHFFITYGRVHCKNSLLSLSTGGQFPAILFLRWQETMLLRTLSGRLFNL